MNQLITLLGVLGLTAYALKPIKAYAWSTDTHGDITSSALDLLQKENKLKLVAFYKDYTDELLKGSKDPDESGDRDKGTGTHYYSCANAKGKSLPSKEGYYQNRLGDYSKSARTMLEENYTSALCLYKNNRISEAMYTLGRAIHFVEDIACPVHTANMRYLPKPGNPHSAFEKHANTISKKYAPVRFDKRLLKVYSGDSFETAANKLSELSNKHAEPISKLDPIAFDNAVKAMVPLAAQNVMALLTKFYDDCKADNGNYLLDGKAYTFKNQASGLVMTVTEKGISLEKPDSKKEQRLTLIMSNEGTFALKANDGGTLSGNLKGYDYAKNDTAGAQFRFASLGKNRYRITLESSKFEKVVACTRMGGIAAADFEPADITQIWILNK
ncbi:MAG: zinc dependent phospholipase C family protein [Ruminococcus sp.]|nr:zinc dependent phospholipase C family protein [Ruminococcus sp.]